MADCIIKVASPASSFPSIDFELKPLSVITLVQNPSRQTLDPYTNLRDKNFVHFRRCQNHDYFKCNRFTLNTAPFLTSIKHQYKKYQDTVDPLAYLHNKGFADFKYLQSITTIIDIYDEYYESFCLTYPLIDAKGNDCGSECIYPKGVLHKKCPMRFPKKQNKKTTKKSKNKRSFSLVGMAYTDLPLYFGTLPIIGGKADAISFFEATGLPCVSIVGEKNARNVVDSLANAFPHLKKHLVVCLDHDKSGVHAAMRSGFPWKVPLQTGMDWNDVYVQQGEKALAAQLQGHPYKPVPAFTLNDMLNMVRNHYINQCNNIEDARKFLKIPLAGNDTRTRATPADCAASAFTFIQHFLYKVPSDLTKEQLLQIITNDCLLVLHPDTLSALKRYIEWYEKKISQAMLNADQISPSHKRALGKRYKAVKSFNKKNVPFKPGRMITVKGLQASGKTQYIKACMKVVKEENDMEDALITITKDIAGEEKYRTIAEHERNKILSINADTGLTLDAAHKLGMTSYLDVLPETVDQVLYLSSTIHSLTKPQVTPFYKNPDGTTKDDLRLLIIDEITQTMNAIASGFGMSNCVEKNFFALLELITDVIRMGNTVILADADLSSFHLKLLEKYLPPDVAESMRVYEKKAEKSKVKVYECSGMKGKNLLTKTFQNYVLAGKTVAVTTDNKKLTFQLEEFVKQLNPKLECLCINADNNGEPNQRAFLKDCNTEAKKYTILIYSPAITSGLSIESIEPDAVFAFHYNIISPFSLIQQAFRLRKNTVLFIATNIQPVPGRCEDWVKAMNALNSMNNFNVPLHEQVYELDDNSYDCFAQKMKTHNNAIKALGGNGLWYLLQQRGFDVRPLSDVIDIEADYSQIASQIREISKRQHDELPGRILNAPIIESDEYRSISGNPHKTLLDSLSCQRYKISRGLGIESVDLQEQDVTFAIDIGMSALRRYSALQGIEVIPDNPKTPLSRRKFGSFEQAALHYMLEGIRNDDGTFQPYWTADEAKEVVNRALAIDKEHPMALVMLGLVPKSMIKGRGQNQFVARPSKTDRETYFLNDFLLKRKLGLKTRAFQKTINGKKVWHYRIDENALMTMDSYSQRRAATYGLKKEARTKGNIIRTAGAGQTTESFSQWYGRRWRCKASKKTPEDDPMIKYFFDESANTENFENQSLKVDSS